MAKFVSPSLLPPALRQDLNLRTLESVSAGLSQLDVAALVVYDFAHVPADALLTLAEQFHVLGDGGWELADDEAKQRALLREAIALHRLKGTRYALERAFELLQIQVRIREWWQQQPTAPAHTFKLEIDLAQAAPKQPILSAEIGDALLRMIRFWKPARSQFQVQVQVSAQRRTRSVALLRPAQAQCLVVCAHTQHLAIRRTRSATLLRPAQVQRLMASSHTQHLATRHTRSATLLRPTQRLSVCCLPHLSDLPQGVSQ